MKGREAVILGCGYVGLRLARLLADAGYRVTGTTRDPDRFNEIRAAGARPVLMEAEEPESISPLAELAPAIVFDTVRPQRRTGDDYSIRATENLAAAFSGVGLEAYVHLSATSVYGRRSGAWTDEETPPDPVSPVGKARLRMERHLLALSDTGVLPVRICRVPGIYGPGRTLRSRLESGRYTLVEGVDQWVSRIHVDDLAAAVVAAATRGRDGRIYLLADDEPTLARDYARLTARLLRLPEPGSRDPASLREELSSSGFERRVSARRCRNRRMREELGVELRYPTVREGVPAALREEGALA